MNNNKKVIIVEGKTDKKHLEKIIIEEIDIICTHGTFSLEKIDELIEQYELDDREVFIFVDSDSSGVKLRRQLLFELSHAKQLFVPEIYKEVALTPITIIAKELAKHHIEVKKYGINEMG